MKKGGESHMIKNKQAPSIMEANILYLLTGLALITIGAQAQAKNIYIGLLITEYLIVMLPTLLFLKSKGYSIKMNLRLNRISLKQAIMVIFIVIFSYPIAVFFNFIALFLLDKLVQVRQNPVPIPSNYLIGFLIIALTPGICEEVMFRGLIMSSYDKLGRRKAIIYSAILFGIFHFNAQNLVGPIFLGLLFGVISYKTNSLIAAIIGHTVNNTIALTIGYNINKFTGGMDPVMDEIVFPQGSEAIMLIVALATLALIFAVIVYLLIKKLPSTTESKNMQYNSVYSENSFMDFENQNKNFGIVEIIPIFIIIVFFVIWNYKYLLI